MEHVTEQEALERALIALNERFIKLGFLEAVDYHVIAFKFGVKKSILAAEYNLRMNKQKKGLY